VFIFVFFFSLAPFPSVSLHKEKRDCHKETRFSLSRPEIDFGLASFGPFRSGSPAVAKIGRRPMNILAMVRAESRYVFVSFSFPAPPSPLPRARPDEIGTVSVFDQSGIALVHEGLFRVARLANGGDQVASRRRHGARHHRLVNLPLMARLFLAAVFVCSETALTRHRSPMSAGGAGGERVGGGGLKPTKKNPNVFIFTFWLRSKLVTNRDKFKVVLVPQQGLCN